MLAVEHRHLQREGIHSVYAAEVHDVLPLPARRLAEGGDAAGLAEMMLRLLPAPLVGAQRAILRIELELLARHQADHRPALRAIRAVAAHAFGDSLRLERELDRATVATGLVGLHGHLLFHLLELLRC